MLEIIISVCLGIGLSASAGFRVFVPLLLLSIAGYMEWIPLNDDWQWAGSLTAIIVLGAASVIELGAYFIPYVDNALDTISIPLATVAGTLVMFTVLGDVDPIYSWTLAIIAGGGTAATISSTTSAARATSTVTTAGFANPLISIFEAISSFFLAFLSLIAPVLAIVAVIAVFFGIRKLYRMMFKGTTLSRKRNNHKTLNSP